jgi:hypothetical protein
LSLQVAHYQIAYGSIPREKLMAMHRAPDDDPQALELAAVGMEILAGTLGWVQNGESTAPQ